MGNYEDYGEFLDFEVNFYHELRFVWTENWRVQEDVVPLSAQIG